MLAPPRLCLGLLACWALPCWLLACGDDGGARERSGLASGLPPDARLSELTGRELAATCEAFVAGINQALAAQLPALQCRTMAVSASIGVSASGQVTFDAARCEQRVEACLAQRADGGVDAGLAVPAAGLDCATSYTIAALRACDATVAQYERCFGAVVDDLRADVPFGCRQAGAALDAGQVPAPAAPARVPPPQCAALIELCPQVAVPPTRASE